MCWMRGSPLTESFRCNVFLNHWATRVSAGWPRPAGYTQFAPGALDFRYVARGGRPSGPVLLVQERTVHRNLKRYEQQGDQSTHLQLTFNQAKRAHRGDI